MNAVCLMDGVGVMGTVVGDEDLLEGVLWLGMVGSLCGVAFWCFSRWRRKWWGWVLAAGCVGVAAGMVRQAMEERERRENASRESGTESDLISLKSRLVMVRVTEWMEGREEMDAEALVKRVVTGDGDEFRRMTDDAGRLVDRWGNGLKIEVGAARGEVRVVSAGADGKFGTEDDVEAGR